MTSLVHIGDIHAAQGPRNADRFAALNQIIDEGSKISHLGAWLIPGDIFDAASHQDDRNALDAAFQRMAALAPVLICYGNHDRPGDLDGFARLKAQHPIYVFDRPTTHYFRLATGERATCFVFPYPHKRGLVAAGIAPGDVVETAADWLEPIFMMAAAELDEARANGDVTFMIGHVNVAGSIASTGQPNIGKEIELSPKHLDRLGRIPKLLNHIHLPQWTGDGGAHYAGSICRLSYGETERKRWLEVGVGQSAEFKGFNEDGPEDGYPVGQVYDTWSHDIDVAPMFLVKGRLSREGFRLDEGTDSEIVRRYHSGDWSGCDVRVQWEYLASELAVLDAGTVESLFDGALRLKLERVAIVDRALRSPAVALARTIPDKLAAYMQVDALPASLAAKLDLLQGHSGPGVVDAVVVQILNIEQPDGALEAV